MIGGCAVVIPRVVGSALLPSLSNKAEREREREDCEFTSAAPTPAQDLHFRTLYICLNKGLVPVADWSASNGTGKYSVKNLETETFTVSCTILASSVETNDYATRCNGM